MKSSVKLGIGAVLAAGGFYAANKIDEKIEKTEKDAFYMKKEANYDEAADIERTSTHRISRLKGALTIAGAAVAIGVLAVFKQLTNIYHN